jgi:hypothetical protein
MRTHYLAANTYFCEIDESIVFLDLNTGKYITIASRAIAALEKSVHGWSSNYPHALQESLSADESDKFLTALTSRGLLTISPEKGKRAAPLVLKTSKEFQVSVLRALERHRLSLLQISEFFRSFLLVSLCMKLKRVPWLYHHLQKIKQRHLDSANHGRPTAEVFELAAVFRDLRPFFFTAREKCLLDSLTMTHFLLSNRCDVSFVIGVGTKPFGAHAWVQHGETVLNDDLDSAQPYSPIFAI